MLKATRASSNSQYVPPAPFWEQVGFDPTAARSAIPITISETQPTSINPYMLAVTDGLTALIDVEGRTQLEINREPTNIAETNLNVINGNDYRLEWDLPIEGTPAGDSMQLTVSDGGTSLAVALVSDVNRSGFVDFTASNSVVRFWIGTNSLTFWLFSSGYPRVVPV